MVRQVAIIVAVAVLIVASLATRHETPAPIIESVEAPADTRLLDEVEALLSKRSTVFEVCDDTIEDAAIAEKMAELDRLEQQVVPVLEASASAEHLLVAALMIWSDEPDRALQLLGEAAYRDPRDPLIVSQLLAVCVEFGGQCSRPRGEIEQMLITADRGNGLAWVQVARSRLERADESGALEAMREAAAAATNDAYFPEYVMMFDRGFSASTDLPAYDRLEAAFGFAAALPASTYFIIQDCRRLGEKSPEWQDACLRLGERQEHDSRTLLSKALGLGLQLQMYELAGNTRSQQETERRQQEFRDSFQGLVQKAGQADRLRDASLAQQYLDTFAASGEFAAMEYLAMEVEARLPGLDSAQPSACSGP